MAGNIHAALHFDIYISGRILIGALSNFKFMSAFWGFVLVYVKFINILIYFSIYNILHDYNCLHFSPPLVRSCVKLKSPAICKAF
jgi:hypothetical protein